MEVYNNDNNDNKKPEIVDNPNAVYNLVQKSKSFILASLSIIITIVSIAVIFIIASIEGTKEIKASNKDSIKLLEIWREKHEKPEGYPKEKEEIIEYQGKEYYFVIKKIDEETKEILKWYYAYDGGFDYIFQDYKYYILTAVASVLSLFVVFINYKSTKEKEKEKENFKKSLNYYQTKKTLIQNETQHLPDYCLYKIKQAYESEKRTIVENAGINYNWYLANNDKLKDYLEKWQLKKLKAIKKIKVERLRTSDLLQEHSKKNGKVSFLPINEGKHQNKYMIKTAITKTLSFALGGVVVAFGFILGGWGLGLTYGTMILMSAVSSILVAVEYVNNDLRNRFITKGDLLQEFFNIKNKFIVKEEIKTTDKKPEKEPEQEKEIIAAEQEKEKEQKQELTPHDYHKQPPFNPLVTPISRHRIPLDPPFQP